MSNLSDVMSLPLQIPDTLPNTWCWKPLTKICKPKQWRTISSSELTDSGYPVFGANGFIGFYSEYNHEKETIAITCRGATCGTLNLVPPKTYITGNSMCLDSLISDVSQRYLFYATQFRTLSDVISGSAQPQITADGLKKVSIPLPPLPEQKKIASILTSVDKVIENTQKQIDKLQDLKKATMNELLTQGIGHTEFKDSELGRIPKGWEVNRLGNYLHEFGKKSRENDEHEVFTSSSKGLMKQSDYYGENRLTRRDNIGFNIIPTGYITYRSRTDSNEFFFNLNNLGKTGLVSKYYPVFTNKNGIEYNQFFAFILNFHTQKFAKEGVGTSQVVLSFNALKRVKLALPCPKEQLEITNILRGVEKNLDVLSKKLQQTQSLKKSLMQDLLTGKVRVTVN